MFLNTDKKVKYIILIQILVSCYNNIKQHKILQKLKCAFLQNYSSDELCTCSKQIFSTRRFPRLKKKKIKLKKNPQNSQSTPQNSQSRHVSLQLWSASLPGYKHSWWGQNPGVLQHPPPSGAEYHTTARLALASLCAGRKIRELIKRAARKWKTEQNKTKKKSKSSVHLLKQYFFRPIPKTIVLFFILT